MTAVPLEKLGLHPRCLLSALWWLGLLYRKPKSFDEAIKEISTLPSRLRAAAILYLHALPLMLLLTGLGQLLVFGLVELPLENPPPEATINALLIWHGSKVAVGIAGGISALRAYYLPFHLFWLWPIARPGLYALHPVAWDDLCSVPFPGLCRLLAALDRGLVEREIDRLIDSYPSQRTEALRARAMIVARDAAGETDLSRLDERVARLPEGAGGFLADVSRLKGMVAEVAQHQRRLATVDAPAFREPLAAGLVVALESFKGSVAGLRYPLAQEFRKAADAWLVVARRQQDEARRVLEAAPAAQVFRAGDPVDKEREAFVPRLELIAELQGQVTLATGCPGLLLYGRRRMGKSTLVRNVEPFLPTSIRVARLSMQDPGAFASLDDLLATIIKAAGEAAGVAVEIGPPGLVGFYRALTGIDAGLAASGRRLLLAIDEYENIDAKIGEGVFPRDLLATFRESVQNHRRIVWLFAGSHAIEELAAADWSSAFVSLRTIELPPFSEAETRLLLTDPLAHSGVWARDDPRRPRFDPAFWGEGGIGRVHAETAGWPHLVQLVAETVVGLVNRRGLGTASPELLEEALARAVEHGDIVLRQLLRVECRLPGEWEYLEGFRFAETQAQPTDDAVRRSLRRRLLVEEAADGGWRLRVPLMRRWLVARG